MSRVKKEIVQAGILKLIEQITMTMPDQKYKFLLGGLSTFATLKSQDKIDHVLNYVSDENGLVDVDTLEKMIEGAFKASDGKIQIELFNNGGLVNLLVKPLTLTIQRNDIMDIMKDIRQNALNNEVTLSQPVQETKQTVETSN